MTFYNRPCCSLKNCCNCNSSLDLCYRKKMENIFEDMLLSRVKEKGEMVKILKWSGHTSSSLLAFSSNRDLTVFISNIQILHFKKKIVLKSGGSSNRVIMVDELEYLWSIYKIAISVRLSGCQIITHEPPRPICLKF